MSSVPYIKFYPTDWRGGVALLTDFQELLYFKICVHNWDTGDGIHEDVVPRLFRDPCEGIADALLTLTEMGKLSYADGKYFNQRALDVHHEAQERRTQAKGAAATRWKDKKKLNNADALPTQANSTCQPEPEPEPKKVKKDIDQAEMGFDIFYMQYPRKVARGQALKAYKTALKKVTHNVIMEGLMKYSMAMTGKDKNFINYPATWLNGERWSDETGDINPEPNPDNPVGGGQSGSIAGVISKLRVEAGGEP
jgi:hypothetical protein